MQRVFFFQGILIGDPNLPTWGSVSNSSLPEQPPPLLVRSTLRKPCSLAAFLNPLLLAVLRGWHSPAVSCLPAVLKASARCLSLKRKMFLEGLGNWGWGLGVSRALSRQCPGDFFFSFSFLILISQQVEFNRLGTEPFLLWSNMDIWSYVSLPCNRVSEIRCLLDGFATCQVSDHELPWHSVVLS